MFDKSYVKSSDTQKCNLYVKCRQRGVLSQLPAIHTLAFNIFEISLYQNIGGKSTSNYL